MSGPVQHPADSKTGAGSGPAECPFCGGRETEVLSLFGTHASLTTHWCRSCHGPFEVLRWRSKPTGEGPE